MILIFFHVAAVFSLVLEEVVMVVLLQWAEEEVADEVSLQVFHQQRLAVLLSSHQFCLHHIVVL